MSDHDIQGIRQADAPIDYADISTPLPEFGVGLAVLGWLAITVAAAGVGLAALALLRLAGGT